MDPWIIETSNQTPQVVNPALWCLLTCVAKFLAVGFNKHSKEELDVDELFRASAPPKLSCLHLGSDYFEAVCTPACTRHEPHPHSCVVFRFFFFFFSSPAPAGPPGQQFTTCGGSMDDQGTKEVY
jgi:hypothetical protein